MGKTSCTVKNRYNKKKYDNILLVLPKGQKDIIKKRAFQLGLSTNMYINNLINIDLDSLD